LICPQTIHTFTAVLDDRRVFPLPFPLLDDMVGGWDHDWNIGEMYGIMMVNNG